MRIPASSIDACVYVQSRTSSCLHACSRTNLPIRYSVLQNLPFVEITITQALLRNLDIENGDEISVGLFKTGKLLRGCV